MGGTAGADFLCHLSQTPGPVAQTIASVVKEDASQPKHPDLWYSLFMDLRDAPEHTQADEVEITVAGVGFEPFSADFFLMPMRRPR
jgi:hypothetical protein|mmetsp:Transcript_72478/g.161061  ORF Transcript_72478/g.161061 Transcript_72478/m.161061 type:complete len:86 (+) Transcript_72478:106-363(+)